MANPRNGPDRDPVDHRRQLVRLRRVEGQVRGLHDMVWSGRPCREILQQVDAVVAALGRVRSDMLRDHMEALVRAAFDGDVPEDRRRAIVDEVAALSAKSR